MTKQVLDAFKSGDKTVCRDIFTLYHHTIYAFVMKIVKSEEIAKDLTHDIFIKLWENKTSILSHKGFNSYLFTLSRNEAFQYLRKKRSENRYLEERRNLNTISNDSGIESEIYSRELMLFVRTIVDKQSEQKRTIFKMSKYEDLSNDEIAEKLGIAKKTVANNLSETLSCIRKEMYKSNA